MPSFLHHAMPWGRRMAGCAVPRTPTKSWHYFLKNPHLADSDNNKHLVSEGVTHKRLDCVISELKEESPFIISLFKHGKACSGFREIPSRFGLIQVFWICAAIFQVLNLGIYSLSLKPTKWNNVLNMKAICKLSANEQKMCFLTPGKMLPYLRLYTAPILIKTMNTKRVCRPKTKPWPMHWVISWKRHSRSGSLLGVQWHRVDMVTYGNPATGQRNTMTFRVIFGLSGYGHLLRCPVICWNWGVSIP